MIFLYSSTLDLSCAFCFRTFSFSDDDDVLLELLESPFMGLLFKLSLQLLFWWLLVTLMALVDDLLLTICDLRFSKTLSSHSSSALVVMDDNETSGKCLAKRSLICDNSELFVWFWKSRRDGKEMISDQKWRKQWLATFDIHKHQSRAIRSRMRVKIWKVRVGQSPSTHTSKTKKVWLGKREKIILA